MFDSTNLEELKARTDSFIVSSTHYAGALALELFQAKESDLAEIHACILSKVVDARIGAMKLKESIRRLETNNTEKGGE